MNIENRKIHKYGVQKGKNSEYIHYTWMKKKNKQITKAMYINTIVGSIIGVRYVYHLSVTCSQNRVSISILRQCENTQ